MEFLICIIEKSDVFMCAPKSEAGFSHIKKKGSALFGCINDKKTQFSLHTTAPSVSKSINFNAIKSQILPNLPKGTYDLLLATNEMIYHIDHEHTVQVDPYYKAIGYKSDVLTGAIFATQNLNMNPEDRIKISLKAASIYEYEIIRL